MFLDKSGKVNDEMSLYSHAAAGVPGSVDGMIQAHQKYGKLAFHEVIQPAIDIAANGFQLTERQAEELNKNKADFIRLNKAKNSFLKDTGEWKKGDLLVQAELAHTLELIRDQGRDGFYTGETANKIVAEMKRGNGLIKLEDLAAYHSVWREPVTGTYKDYKIISMPPPSSGGIALLQLLKMVEKYPVEDWQASPEKTMHLFIEAMRRVYADRAEHLGDADFYPVPQNALLESIYLENRMKDFNTDKASLSEKIESGNPEKHISEETTHYSVADQWGNAVSVTTTLNNSYGSRIVVQGAGFLLNDEMDDFSLKPGVPNMYGLVGGQANAIEPGKRMLSSMTPTIIEKDGKLFMVVGSPGGSTIITIVFQTIVNVIDNKMDMQEAVDAARFHHQWLPDLVYLEENRFDSLLVKKLENLGHNIKFRGPMGRVDAILVLPDGSYQGGADPRGDDKAMGY
jgi:gamma-glutamyltranspeptidase/glutathione hydrolase